jgi:putative SOS response-associated peptidase YedK
MCGRFALSIIPAHFQRTFGCAAPEGLRPRYNVAPDSSVVAARTGESGEREAAWLRWGMLGPWMKEARDPGRQINARAETAAEKPMFRDAFKRSRCLIPALGFYEWQKAGAGPSRPFFTGLASGEPMAFAGLWRRSRLADGETIETCTILTTTASPLLRPIHHRMPVILPEAAWDAWLDPKVSEPELLQALLTPVPDAELVAHEVGRAVNNPRNDAPSLIEPAVPAVEARPAQGSLL